MPRYKVGIIRALRSEKTFAIKNNWKVQFAFVWISPNSAIREGLRQFDDNKVE